MTEAQYFIAVQALRAIAAFSTAAENRNLTFSEAVTEMTRVAEQALVRMKGDS